jgi:tight adherence protein B
MAAVTAALLVAGAVLVLTPPASERRVHAIATGASAARTPPLVAITDAARKVVGRVGLGPASRRRRAQQRMRAIQALGALAAELDVGQPPREAMRRAGGQPCVWPVTLGALDLDGEVAAALDIDATQEPVLLQLAACWRVAADSGAGLAASVGRLAAAARAAEDVRVDLEGQLAGPRATARMLAVLPLVGIGFGMMLGSDPLAWLLTSTPGRACLLGGAALTAVGTWWTGRIAARVERML